MPSSSVLLTGGNGFIAVHILQQLLDRGHSVTTTVRSEGKAKYLRNKFSAAISIGKLKFAIVEDITIPGAFDTVIQTNSFDHVLHTSSPFVIDINDVEKDLLQPAIQGTTGILHSTKNYGPTVKRVVITSSFVSVLDPTRGDRPGYVYTDKDWNPITYDLAKEDPLNGYYGSKTLAEKAAWEFYAREEPQYELVTLCPPFVYGPLLQEVTSLKKLNTSSAQLYTIFSGEAEELQNAEVWTWVDVRDTAQAHVAAIERSELAGKRIQVSAGTFNVAQIADFIWANYPARAMDKGVPKSTPSVGFPPGGTYTTDNGPSKELLGIDYISFETTLKDTFDQFLMLERELGST